LQERLLIIAFSGSAYQPLSILNIFLVFFPCRYLWRNYYKDIINYIEVLVIHVQMLELLDINSLEMTATNKYDVTYMSGAS